MNYYIKLLLFIALFTSCSDDLDTLYSIEEMQIVADCKSNSFDSIAELEQNLIGKWELTGYACGLCEDVSNVGKTIVEFTSDKKATIRQGKDQIEVTWEVVKPEPPNPEQVLQLIMNPSDNRFDRIMYFCEEHMIHETINDIFIYEKV